MRAARLILLAVASCAIAAALGTIAFAAASHDEPGLGPAVHVGQTHQAHATPDHPTVRRSGRAGTHDHAQPGAPGTTSSHPQQHSPRPTSRDAADDEGATRATTSPRHAGDDDDDEGEADDDHDEDGDGD